MTKIANWWERLRPPSADDELLREAFARAGVSLDDLPYTPQLDEIVQMVTGAGANDQSRQSTYRRLVFLRKTGQLPTPDSRA